MTKTEWFTVHRVTKCHSKWCHSTSCLSSIVAMFLSCTGSEMQRSIGRKSKTIVPTPAVFDARLCMTPLEFHQDLWHQKNQSPWDTVWLSLHKVYLFFDKYRRGQTAGETDRPTDGWSPSHSIYRSSTAWRDENLVELITESYRRLSPRCWWWQR